MKILFVSHTYLRKDLGASKVVLEVGEEMQRLGWECDYLSMAELAPGGTASGNEGYANALRAYLREHAGEYDVVDYDHNCLPFPRSEFAARTLMVARSVLLAHHFDEIPIPVERSWKAQLHARLYRRREEVRKELIIGRAQRTLLEADLVNVANDHDRELLVRKGIPADRIAVFPYGLGRERQPLFEAVSTAPPDGARVAFVGTFDGRKGATDFPKIARTIVARAPSATFLLLGTHRSADEVRAAFPRSLRARIQVTPRYAAESLHELLAPCAVGIFPSYIEGFGFGVLEMLAAAMPVIAYDAPGPPMMLPARYLVPRGDAAAMGAKVAELLNDRAALAAARAWAKERARRFSWPAIAKQTSDVYTDRWQSRQTTSRTG